MPERFMWIEEHWGPFSGIVAAVLAAISWFLRLELRLAGLDSRVKTNSENASKALEKIERYNEEAVQQMAALHEKINVVATTVSRIEGYCSGRRRDCDGPSKTQNQ